MDLTDLDQHETKLELLTTALDRKANAHPEKAWAAVPVDTDDLSKGLKEITWRTLQSAVDKLSWWIDENIGNAHGKDFPTIAYLGSSDLRYIFLSVASIKTGYKILLLQPTLSIAGILNLFDKTDCHILVTGEGTDVSELRKKRRFTAYQAPSVLSLMDDQHVKAFPHERCLKDGLNDPIMVLHTSGSTGLPKPVVLSHGHIAANALNNDVPALDGHETLWNMMRKTKRFYVGFPMAHAGGTHYALKVSAYNRCCVVMSESKTLNGTLLAQMIEYGKIECGLVMPRALIEIADDSDGLEKLRRLKVLSFAGGTVPSFAGDLVAARTPLINVWGSTELGSQVTHATEPEDWSYNHLSPWANTIDWRPVTSGLFEAVPVPNKDPVLRRYQQIFWTFPHLREFHTGDLFSKHPTKANHFKFEGRLDDMITMDSGHNFHPSFFINEILLHDPKIKSAVFLGHQKRALALIIEPASPNTTVDDLWLTVQMVNERATQQAQIGKNQIIIGRPEKPLPKGGKGNVVWKKAQELYANELDRIWKG